MAYCPILLGLWVFGIDGLVLVLTNTCASSSFLRARAAWARRRKRTPQRPSRRRQSSHLHHRRSSTSVHHRPVSPPLEALRSSVTFTALQLGPQPRGSEELQPQRSVP